VIDRASLWIVSKEGVRFDRGLDAIVSLAGCGKTHWRIGFRREIFLVPGFYSPPLVEHKTLQDCSLRIKLDEFRLAVPLPAFFGLFTGEVA
jgi:hypothetical protein